MTPPIVDESPPCAQVLGRGPLVCTRTDAHDPGHGCIYVSTSGVPRAPKEEM